MQKQVDLFDSTYSNFTQQVLTTIRKETFGNDIGQNSWLTADEYDRFISWLGLKPEHHILELASGSGGPARYIVNKIGCRLTGIDINESGINASSEILSTSNEGDRLNFKLADANAPLPFNNEIFNAVICIDSMNHFPNRLGVLEEWYRVICTGGRAIFTDPVVITGPVTNEELALRSSIGLFLFVPPKINEQLIINAGFNLLHQEDVSENCAMISGRWKESRERHKDALLKTARGTEQILPIWVRLWGVLQTPYFNFKIVLGEKK